MDPPHVDDVLSSCTSDPEIQNFIYYENEWSATDADCEQFPVDFSKAARTDEDSAGHGVVAKGRNSRGSAPKRGGAIVAKRQSKVVSDDVGGGQQNNRLFQELALAFANQLEAQRMLACWRLMRPELTALADHVVEGLGSGGSAGRRGSVDSVSRMVFEDDARTIVQAEPPAHLFPQISLGNVEFVLVDGPPLSGKNALGKAIAEAPNLQSYVQVVFFDRMIERSRAALLEYEPQKPPEQDEGGAAESATSEAAVGTEEFDDVPDEVSAFRQTYPDRFRQMREAMLAALDAGPPKKGEPDPKEGVREDALKDMPVTQTLFEAMLAAKLKEVVRDLLKGMHAKNEELAGTIREKWTALRNAKVTAEEALKAAEEATAAAEEKTAAAEEANAAGEEVVPPPDGEENEDEEQNPAEILEQRREENFAALQKLEKMVLRAARPAAKSYVVLVVGAMFPRSEAEIIGFMENSVFPAIAAQPDQTKVWEKKEEGEAGVTAAPANKRAPVVDQRVVEGLLKKRAATESEYNRLRRATALVVPGIANVDTENFDAVLVKTVGFDGTKNVSPFAQPGSGAGSSLIMGGDGGGSLSSSAISFQPNSSAGFNPSSSASTPTPAATTTSSSSSTHQPRHPGWLPVLKKVYLTVPPDKLFERRQDPATFPRKQIPDSFYENPEEKPGVIDVFPYSRTSTGKDLGETSFVNDVFDSRLFLNTVSSSSNTLPTTSFTVEMRKRKLKKGESGKTKERVRRTCLDIRADKREVSEIMSEFLEKTGLSEQVVDEAAPSDAHELLYNASSAARRASTRFQTWNKILLNHLHLTFGLVKELDRDFMLSFRKDLAQQAEDFKAFVDTRNAALSKVIFENLTFTTTAGGFAELSESLTSEVFSTPRPITPTFGGVQKRRTHTL